MNSSYQRAFTYVNNSSSSNTSNNSINSSTSNSCIDDSLNDPSTSSSDVASFSPPTSPESFLSWISDLPDQPLPYHYTCDCPNKESLDHHHHIHLSVCRETHVSEGNSSRDVEHILSTSQSTIVEEIDLNGSLLLDLTVPNEANDDTCQNVKESVGREDSEERPLPTRRFTVTHHDETTYCGDECSPRFTPPLHSSPLASSSSTLSFLNPLLPGVVCQESCACQQLPNQGCYCQSCSVNTPKVDRSLHDVLTEKPYPAMASCNTIDNRSLSACDDKSKGRACNSTDSHPIHHQCESEYLVSPSQLLVPSQRWMAMGVQQQHQHKLSSQHPQHRLSRPTSSTTQHNTTLFARAEQKHEQQLERHLIHSLCPQMASLTSTACPSQFDVPPFPLHSATSSSHLPSPVEPMLSRSQLPPPTSLTIPKEHWPTFEGSRVLPTNSEVEEHSVHNGHRSHVDEKNQTSLLPTRIRQDGQNGSSAPHGMSCQTTSTGQPMNGTASPAPTCYSNQMIDYFKETKEKKKKRQCVSFIKDHNGNKRKIFSYNW